MLAASGSERQWALKTEHFVRLGGEVRPGGLTTAEPDFLIYPSNLTLIPPLDFRSFVR